MASGTGPSQIGFCVSIAPYAVLKSAITVLEIGATIVPVIVHQMFVMVVEVVPTLPMMLDPGPVLVQVTVPVVGAALVPSTV